MIGHPEFRIPLQCPLVLCVFESPLMGKKNIYTISRYSRPSWPFRIVENTRCWFNNISVNTCPKNIKPPVLLLFNGPPWLLIITISIVAYRIPDHVSVLFVVGVATLLVVQGVIRSHLWFSSPWNNKKKLFLRLTQLHFAKKYSYTNPNVPYISMGKFWHSGKLCLGNTSSTWWNPKNNQCEGCVLRIRCKIKKRYVYSRKKIEIFSTELSGETEPVNVSGD